ncbi:MAG: POTRA domain-containing protein [Pseudohongiellaceae bacterium]
MRLALLSGCVCFGMQAMAQNAGVASGLGQNIERGFSGGLDGFDEPSFDLDLQPDSSTPAPQVLPPPDMTQGEERANVLSTSLAVTDIVVDGSSVFSAEDISAVVAPFENRDLSPENLQELLRRLSLLYFNNGYVNSGVVLPDGEPSPGVLTLRAIEGELQEVQILENERLSRPYVETRLRRNIDKPLNLNDLQDSLRMLELNPLIRQVNGVLVPGLTPGVADLRLRVQEEQPALVSWTTMIPVSVRSALLTLEHLNHPRADRLALAVSAEGLQDASPISFR